jgi:hypothetical protein
VTTDPETLEGLPECRCLPPGQFEVTITFERPEPPGMELRDLAKFPRHWEAALRATAEAMGIAEGRRFALVGLSEEHGPDLDEAGRLARVWRFTFAEQVVARDH